MIAGLAWEVALVCVVAMYVGATVQSGIGIGMGMITAPVLAIADPAFIRKLRERAGLIPYTEERLGH